jgi:hypothetical protein
MWTQVGTGSRCLDLCVRPERTSACDFSQIDQPAFQSDRQSRVPGQQDAHQLIRVVWLFGAPITEGRSAEVWHKSAVFGESTPRSKSPIRSKTSKLRNTGPNASSTNRKFSPAKLGSIDQDSFYRRQAQPQAQPDVGRRPCLASNVICRVIGRADQVQLVLELTHFRQTFGA